MRGHPKGRRRTPCRHCDMVDQYRWERDRQVRETEVAAGDESRLLIVFKRWLQTYGWEAAA